MTGQMLADQRPVYDNQKRRAGKRLTKSPNIPKRKKTKWI